MSANQLTAGRRRAAAFRGSFRALDLVADLAHLPVGGCGRACGYAICLLLTLLLLLEGQVLLVRRPGADFKPAGGTVVRHTHQPLR